MSGSLLGRVWAWLHRTFPERQVYVRSEGRVQFFTLGPTIQATLAGLSLIFLGWVAFATVNVVFKDRIIAAKERRYQQMQATYENRVVDLQISYDALNGALVAAEDRFKSAADAVEGKQNAIAGVIAQQSRIQTAAAKAFTAAPAPQPKLTFGAAAASGEDADAMDSPGADDPASGTTRLGGASRLLGLPKRAPRAAGPQKSSMLEHIFRRIAALFAPAPNPAALPESVAFMRHPGLRILAQQTARLAKADGDDGRLLSMAEGNLEEGLGNLRNLIHFTGIDPDRFAARLAAGTGGPEIPIREVRMAGMADSRFTQAYLGAAATLERLGSLSRAAARIPLALPVAAQNFDRTSGFGPRIDPFTGRIAFHPGIDFAGPWGAAVHATAPGKVVFAGNHGGYGNMVEIDHGNGIHTRYGHLSAVTVRVGMHVGRGDTIGRVGSTGRSTGPHVHYEVWYDDVVRNPSNFIEAGRHVL
jgi:murein DD-endopeptidase MepM/ murein hydrolase activator NlpD